MLQKGSDILIVKGKYKGESGIILRLTDKKVKIKLQGNRESGLIPKSSVIPREKEHIVESRTEIANRSIKKDHPSTLGVPNTVEYRETDNEKFDLIEGRQVFVEKGTYKGKYGIVKRTTAKKVKYTISISHSLFLF